MTAEDRDVRLAELAKQAEEAWPQFSVSRARFVAYLAERAGDGDLAALQAPDLYLACACVDGDRRAIEELDKQYFSQLPRLVRAEPAVIDELRQLLATRLLVASDGKPPRLEKYGGRGPLVTWLKVTATRALSNLRRSRDDRAAAEDKAAAADPHTVAGVDPELALIRQRFGIDFHDALAAAFASLEPRERNLLRLYFVERVPIDGLAPIFQVSRATAARHLAAARRALTERTIDQLGGRLRLAKPELDSLIRQMRSKLDVRLSAVLRV